MRTCRSSATKAGLSVTFQLVLNFPDPFVEKLDGVGIKKDSVEIGEGCHD